MSTVLVVDRHEPVRALIRHMLEPVGYDVEEAGDLKEALAVCAGRRYDVVMLDIVQPVKEGLEAVLRIRHALPGAKIVAMTGQLTPAIEILEVSRLFGAHATLMKPFAPDTLFTVLSSLWRRRAMPGGSSCDAPSAVNQ